jgi:tetratricopeptide (TPR) repeat protein
MLFHATNALLFYFVLLTICRRQRLNSESSIEAVMPLIGALLFAVHPLMTESVTYIAGRASSLAAVFFFGSLLLYLRGQERAEQQGDGSAISTRKGIFYGLSLLVFFLSLWVKESNATLPAIILLADFYFFEQGQGKRLQYSVRRSIPFFLILFGILAWRKIYIGAIGDEFQVRDFTVNLLTQLRVTVNYLRLLLFPLGQNVDHDLPLSHSLFEAETMVSLLILVGLALLSAALFKKNKLASFGILWFFITLTPTAVVPLWDVMSERWIYLPAAGIFLSIVSLLPLLQKVNQKIPEARVHFAPVIIAVIVFILGLVTVARNGVWRDEYTLWKDAADKSPGKTRPHINLGMALAEMGNLDEAIAELDTARSIDPASLEANFSLSTLYLKSGKYDDAIATLSATFRQFPDTSLIPVRQADDFAKSHFNLGVAFFYKGWYERALAEYRTALQLAPYLEWVHSNIGVIYEMRGDFESAIAEYQRELELHPEASQVVQNIQNVKKKMQEQQLGAAPGHRKGESIQSP